MTYNHAVKVQAGLVYDPRYLAHDTGCDHCESPDRLETIMSALDRAGLLARVQRIQPRPATPEEVCLVHSALHVERLARACRDGQAYVDVPDCAICPASFDVALLAVGGVLAAADAVMGGQVTRAFCAVRPPGHHAERERSLGFCLLNNVAIAARYLQQRRGLKRGLIADWAGFAVLMIVSARFYGLSLLLSFVMIEPRAAGSPHTPTLAKEQVSA